MNCCIVTMGKMSISSVSSSSSHCFSLSLSPSLSSSRNRYQCWTCLQGSDNICARLEVLSLRTSKYWSLTRQSVWLMDTLRLGPLPVGLWRRQGKCGNCALLHCTWVTKGCITAKCQCECLAAGSYRFFFFTIMLFFSDWLQNLFCF